MGKVKWIVGWTVVATVVGGLALIGLSAPAKAVEDRVELGDVDWHRDFQQAKQLASRKGKPLFVLFTEVPGCSTVRGYGKRVLSDPRVVDAIEEEFVPVAIFNNVEGEDREVLKSFGEPTWNNPAVRVIRPDRRSLAPRMYGDYSVEATVETMTTALEKTDGGVPPYLSLFARELAGTEGAETAIFEMYCFWTGEAKLGRLEGVLETRPGFLEGTEVVEVTYDAGEVDLVDLARRAKQTEAASSLMARTDEELAAGRSVFGDAVRQTDGEFRYAADDDNHALQGTPYEQLEMTELQATRVNSAVAAGESPAPFLFPHQREEVGE